MSFRPETPAIPTPLGAKVRVSPVGPTTHKHLGQGVFLELTMRDPKDTRRAEVFLDPDSAQRVAALLLDGIVTTGEMYREAESE